MRRNTKTEREAAFIAALTATDQLDGTTDATIRREDNKDHGRAMQRLCFLAEAAHLRACAVYQDELADMYARQRFEIPEDLTTRMTAVRLLREAVDRYVALPARNKTQAAMRAGNVKRWQHHVVGGFDPEDVCAWKAHVKRWIDAIAAEREHFARATQRQHKGAQ